MRILNLDGHYFVAPFREMGHEVLWLGSDPGCDVRLETVISLADLMALLKERAFTPDLVVWSDICRPPSVIGIESLPAVTVGFSIDQYCNPWHMAYAAAFDLMLVAQKDYLPLFEQEQLGNDLEWFPLFCNPSPGQGPEALSGMCLSLSWARWRAPSTSSASSFSTISRNATPCSSPRGITSPYSTAAGSYSTSLPPESSISGCSRPWPAALPC